MRILVDIGHPAHVHLFRHAIGELEQRGHSVCITAREKDVVTDLLDAYGFRYTVASRARRGRFGLFRELLEHDWHVYRTAKRDKSDLLMGTSVSVAHAGRLLRARSIVFSEDDCDVARTFARLAYPFADFVVTPRCVRHPAGRKYVSHDSLHKLAYLHPKRFTPDPSVLSALGLEKEEPFFLVRFVSFGAAHDRGEGGMPLNLKRDLLRLLSENGRTFISSEGPLPDWARAQRFPLAAHKMHDALYWTRLLVGESQSMAVEAAVLGTPSVRCNSFGTRCSVLEELERVYGLTYSFLPNEGDKMLQQVSDLLASGRGGEWEEKRRRLLRDKEDLTDWIVRFIERLPESRRGRPHGKTREGQPSRRSLGFTALRGGRCGGICLVTEAA